MKTALISMDFSLETKKQDDECIKWCEEYQAVRAPTFPPTIQAVALKRCKTMFSREKRNKKDFGRKAARIMPLAGRKRKGSVGSS